jgi:hypothetical protein
MPPLMNDTMMADGTMMGCMIACAFFVLAILIAAIIQTVTQVKILSEIRTHFAAKETGRKDANRS